MAIRKPTLWPSQRTDATAKELLAEAIERASADDPDLPYLRGVLDAVKVALKLERRRRGRKLARQLAKTNDAGYDEGYVDGAREEYLNAREDDRDCLDRLVEEPASKWASPYVRRLGALEHCDEVLTLHRAEAVAKAKGRKGAVEPALVRELADLWCVLEMCRRGDPSFAVACSERAERFRPC
jgi:hypothetical protein